MQRLPSTNAAIGGRRTSHNPQNHRTTTTTSNSRSNNMPRRHQQQQQQQQQQQVQSDETSCDEGLSRFSDTNRNDDDDDDDDPLLGSTLQATTAANDALTESETAKYVQTLRYTLLSVLCVGTVLVTTAVYVILSYQHVLAFQSAVTVASQHVTMAVQDQLHGQLLALQGLALQYSSNQQQQQQQQTAASTMEDCYTLAGNFTAQTASVRSLLHSSRIALLPVLSNRTEKTAWELYAAQHARDWIPTTTASSESAVAAGLPQKKLRPAVVTRNRLDPLLQTAQSETTTLTTSTTTATARRRRVTGDDEEMKQENEPNIAPHVFNTNETDAAGPGPFVPLWQVAPWPASNALLPWINFDMLSDPSYRTGLLTLLLQKQYPSSAAVVAVMEGILPVAEPEEDDNNNDADATATAATVLERHAQLRRRDASSTEASTDAASTSTTIPNFFPDAPQQQSAEPASPLLYPVLGKKTLLLSNDNTTPEQESLVAVLMSIQPWRFYFTHVLSSTSTTNAQNNHKKKKHHGHAHDAIILDCVVQNECDQSFTFRLDGSTGTVEYKGMGDHHEGHWHHYGTHMNLIAAANQNDNKANDENDNPAAALLDDTYACGQYTLHVYPTKAMKQSFSMHHQWQAILCSMATALLFVLAAMIFVIYDGYVERRQQVVMDRALQSTAIVSSLFPETVRDRLFRGSTGNGTCGTGNASNPSGTMLNNNNNNNNMHNSLHNENTMNGFMPRNSSFVDDDDFNNNNNNGQGNMMSDITNFVEPAKYRLKSFLSDSNGYEGQQVVPRNGGVSRSASNVTNNSCMSAMGGASGVNTMGLNKPIADLFPYCTVLFADISGFTAWSSLRDPAQVFTLLEAVYQAFDKIARKRGVFKVETVGDSYVAVTGLPDPQEDHPILMSRFARDCRLRMNEVTRKLERTLGPDTGDLRMRFGLHSGPVTAGVLRGEKSRFQLFGDTVNTAARMESTGERDRIQCSQATADLLKSMGKGHWLKARENLVHAKGKGNMQTYWIEIIKSNVTAGFDRRGSCSSDDSRMSVPESDGRGGGRGKDKSMIWGIQEEIPEEVTQLSKHKRLIDYNVDLLAQHLKHIVARRQVLEMAGKKISPESDPPKPHCLSMDGSTVLDEVTEVIKLPSFDATAFKDHVDPDTIKLDPKVMSQLKRYVSVIAAMYRNNPFHNFEHASHVTMSVNKLLQRVVAPEMAFRRESLQMTSSKATQKLASDLHNYTCGITSDPLTQFAVVFSALIHDVDHWGISNAQLIKEGAPMADKYKCKSIAEQNSVDLAWDLLMDPDEYGDLQRCIFLTDSEYRRLRQVVVNVVMATDIFDKELGELRKNRWDKVFSENARGDEDHDHRKATIVIEHIMQASDVAHTMQHWHVYQKWNRRLFDELYTAYKAQRMEKDPSTFWYEGELKFFDGYVIPLAKKLKECGVFGVASDECLSYALNNRKEWEAKGQMIVEELVSNYNQREMEEQQLLEQAQAAEQAQQPRRKKGGRMSRRRSLFTSGG